jgi:hypothetical protein
MGANFTRLDIAAPDIQGMLDLKGIVRKTINKCEILCMEHAGH